MAMVFANMPVQLRQDLLSVVEAAFPNQVHDMDSSQVPDYQFDAYHFSYYNRYGAKVCFVFQK